MREYPKIKLKYVAELFNGNSIPDDKKDEFTDRTIPYIPTKEIDANTGLIKYDNGLSVNPTDGFRIAPTDSTLMCIEGGSAGRKIGIIDRPVAFVNKLCCFNGVKIYNRLLYYCLQSKDFTEQFQLNMTGLIGGVSVSSLNNIYISNPDKEKQAEIANILDNVSNVVNILVSKQEKQIEKLKAYKQSIITEVVTKGLDPTVPMKDSGVEWIGEIPRHWMLSKLIKLSSRTITYGIVKLGNHDENGVKVLRCSDVREGYIDESNIRTVSKNLSNAYARTILRGNEVVVNVRGSLGGCAVVPESMAGYNIAREVAMVDVQNCNPHYVKYVLLSKVFATYQDYYLAGSVYVGLNIDLLNRFQVPLPERKEQDEIVNWLDNKCSQIDRLISIKQSKIDKLNEYKKSLIYEYVTGKKEVM